MDEEDMTGANPSPEGQKKIPKKSQTAEWL